MTLITPANHHVDVNEYGEKRLSPRLLKQQIPLSEGVNASVQNARYDIINILFNEFKRFINSSCKF
jgi:hypothetical protein